MVFLEFVARAGLLISQPATYAVVVLIGFLTYKEKWFAQALMILLFTMIYNTYLKSVWQVPLAIYLEGWALPSGHMHSAFVFWGMIAYWARNTIVWAVTLFMLTLCGYGLVYQGYHQPIDVLAAMGFGTLSLIIYALLERTPLYRQRPYLFGGLYLVLGLFISFILLKAQLKPHIFQALGGLAGFTLGYALFHKPNGAMKLRTKLIGIAVCVVGMLLIQQGLGLVAIAANVKIFVLLALVTFWLNVVRGWMVRKR